MRVAIDLADREGLGALSMRRIATELGLATMSIYRYLPGKDATERDAGQDTGITQEQWLTQQDATFTEILRKHPLPVLRRVTADPSVEVELDGLFEFGLARLLDGFATLITPAQYHSQGLTCTYLRTRGRRRGASSRR